MHYKYYWKYVFWKVWIFIFVRERYENRTDPNMKFPKFDIAAKLGLDVLNASIFLDL